MKNKKQANKFDGIVEGLMQAFSKIDNLHLVTDDPAGAKAFNSVIFRIADIISYKELVSNHFVPAANKAIANSKNDVNRSRYKSLIDPRTMDFSETLYETLRLAYVGLFHKLESFIMSLEELGNTLFPNEEKPKQSVINWVKGKYGFDFKDWSRFPTIDRIHWICICVKHYDGFPEKKPVPLQVILQDPGHRIRPTLSDFKTDCDNLLKIYNAFISSFLAFATCKHMLDDIDKNSNPEDPEWEHQQTELKNKIELEMQGFLTNVALPLRHSAV